MKKAGIVAALSIVLGASFCSAGAPRHKPVVVAPQPRHKPVVVAPPPEPVVVVAPPPPEPVVVVAPPPPEPVVVVAPPPPEPHHGKHHSHTGGIVRDIGKAASGIIHELKE